MEQFINPSNEYRPIPFWSWNDKLSADKLRNQIREMHKAGLGGFFMHARGGLETEYLSEEWFECVRASIEEAKELGMHAWLYDEEGWPSGFAGGRVTAIGEEYQAKTLRYRMCGSSSELSKLSGVTAVFKLSDSRYERINGDAPGLAIEAEETVFAAYVHINPHYIDVCSKKAVDAFIQETHEKYYRLFKKDFGETMKGFFTDEPRFVTEQYDGGKNDMPWSYELESIFLEKYGYSIIGCLPALFMDVCGFEKVRYDFWQLINDMFAGSFMKNIYDWCDAHGCLLTGHIMMEESVYSQMSSTGGVMPMYEYLHIPGIDWLRRRLGHPNAPKQVGSAAVQLGKKHVLTESFALCGWDVTLEELKWIAQWQFVNGVNALCQHLQGYTIKGLRKRDYPPSLFTQQTWWGEYRRFNDAIARIGSALTEGTQRVRVIVLHPIRSGWVCYDGTRNERMKALDRSFEELSEYLSGQHIDYHYGDETIIKKYGRVEGNKFIISSAVYDTVVIPQCYAIDGFTLELLAGFILNGGKVVVTGSLPGYTNGSKESLNILEKNAARLELEGLRQWLVSQGLAEVSIASQETGTEIGDIAYQKRTCADYDILYIVNNSREHRHHAAVTLYGGYGDITLLSPEDGGYVPVYGVTRENGNTAFCLEILPMQSYLLRLAKTNYKAHIHAEAPAYLFVRPGSEWTADSMSLNTMTLDYCEYRIDDGEWLERTHTITLMSKLIPLKRPVKTALRFTFDVDMDMRDTTAFFAIIEDAGSFMICVNGTELTYEDIGFFKDEPFKKVDIKPFIVRGSNEIILEKVFYQRPHVYDVLLGDNVYETELNKLTYDTELESIYLLGDFGVYSRSGYMPRERNAIETDGPFVITERPTRFTSNNFTEHGLCFFSGELEISQMIYVRDDQPVKLLLNKPYAPMVKVFINGRFVKDILWTPYEADITEYVSPGENKVTLRLYSSNRNLLGPHHHINGELYNAGPQSFTGRWSWVERESEADVDENMDKNAVYWTDSYCFTKFGFEDGGTGFCPETGRA